MFHRVVFSFVLSLIACAGICPGYGGGILSRAFLLFLLSKRLRSSRRWPDRSGCRHHTGSLGRGPFGASSSDTVFLHREVGLTDSPFLRDVGLTASTFHRLLLLSSRGRAVRRAHAGDCFFVGAAAGIFTSEACLLSGSRTGGPRRWPAARHGGTVLHGDVTALGHHFVC